MSNNYANADFLRYVEQLTQGEQLTLHCTIVESLRAKHRVTWEGNFWTNNEAKVLQKVLEDVINARLAKMSEKRKLT